MERKREKHTLFSRFPTQRFCVTSLSLHLAYDNITHAFTGGHTPLSLISDTYALVSNSIHQLHSFNDPTKCHNGSGQEPRCDEEARPYKVISQRASENHSLTYCSLGRNVVSFRVSGIKCHFIIHENLLCKTSKYFKQLLQKDRKALEGECSICHESLDPGLHDITLCRAKCGQNFHGECISVWRAQYARTTCPMCRQAWEVEPRSLKHQFKYSELDHNAVQLYCDWLYTGRIQIDESMAQDSRDFGLLFLKAWDVALRVRDTDFRHALIACFISENKHRCNF